MPGRVGQRLILVSLGATLLVGFAVARAQQASPATSAPTFKPEQAVEVREGDEWSPATVVKREGRKYQIRYADGTEEWVAIDRIRKPGAAAAADAPSAKGKPAAGGKRDKAGAPGAARPAAKPKAAKDRFEVGAKIEVQHHGRWEKGTVRNRDGDLYLVGRDGWDKEFFWIWVHVRSVRKPGTNKPGLAAEKSVTVGNMGVAKAKAEAKRLFADIDAEPDAGAADGKDNPFAPVPYDKPVADTNLDRVEELLPAGAPVKLGEFDGAPANSPKFAEQSYVLRGKGVWPSEGPAGVLMAGTRGVIWYQSGGAADARTLNLELLDLAAGKNLGLVKADPLSMPLELSPSGQRLIGRQHGFHNGTRMRVDLFTLGKGAAAPKHLVSFIPYVSADFFWKDVEWAGFAGDDEHVLTLNNGGDLICWHAATATAKWRMKVRGGTAPARSPGGRQIAVATDLGIAVIDLAGAKVACVVPGARAARGLSFTPDGKRVVGASSNTLSVWDLATGEALPGIGLPAKGAAGDPIALDGRFVLIGGMDVLDLEKKVVVWRYARPAGSGGVSQHGGRTWSVLADGGRNVLVGAALPHAAAVAAADALAGGQRLLVKPGDAVSLTVAIEATPEQQQKIKAAITEQLQQSGIAVADNAAVKLVARTERGKTQEQEYRGRGMRHFERDKVNVTEKITRIYFEADGKVAWESRVSSGAPMFVTVEAGQTVNDAVQAASQFDLGFLEAVRVPAYVPAPAEVPGLGQSKWTLQGVADEPRGGANAPAAAAAGDGLN